MSESERKDKGERLIWSHGKEAYLHQQIRLLFSREMTQQSSAWEGLGLGRWENKRLSKNKVTIENSYWIEFIHKIISLVFSWILFITYKYMLWVLIAADSRFRIVDYQEVQTHVLSASYLHDFKGDFWYLISTIF